MVKMEPAAWEKVFKRNDSVVFREIAGEMFLVPVRGKLADMQNVFALNRVAGFIWERLDGAHTLAGIRDAIPSQFDVTTEEAGRDIQELIQILLAKGLIAE